MELLTRGFHIGYVAPDPGRQGRAWDAWLSDQTRVVEKRYKELGGQITVLIKEGEGHFPISRKDPKPVVDFIVSQQR